MENNISKEDIEKLAKLSAFSFSEKDKDRMIGEVSSIIDMLNECDKVDTSKIEYDNVVSIDDLRDDEVLPSMPLEDVLLDAPKQKRDYFNVPKVVE